MRLAVGMVRVFHKMRGNFAFIGEVHYGLRARRSFDRNFRQQALRVLEVWKRHKKRTILGEHDLHDLVTMAVRRHCYHHALGKDAFDLHVEAALALQLPDETAQLGPPGAEDFYWSLASLRSVRRIWSGRIHSARARGAAARGEGDCLAGISERRSRRSAIPQVPGRPSAKMMPIVPMREWPCWPSKSRRCGPDLGTTTLSLRFAHRSDCRQARSDRAPEAKGAFPLRWPRA